MSSTSIKHHTVTRRWQLYFFITHWSIDKYRITAVMNVETDITASNAASPKGQTMMYFPDLQN